MQSVRGMQDILPEDVKYWQHIYNIALELLDSANYQEIRTPIVEHKSLFDRSIGQDTDIISKEMYTFYDRSNRALTLRPEGTAGIARAIIQNHLYKNNSIQKLWYLGPMFRYERPQQGRQRQFHQLGIECYGSNHPVLDAEVIYLAYNLLKRLKCGDTLLEINSIGSKEERKLYKDKLQEYFLQYINNLDDVYAQQVLKNPLRLLDSKDSQVKLLITEAPKITQYLKKQSIQRFDCVQQYLYDLNIKFTLNHNLVRGLDYYNDTVFELKTKELGAQDTICGGGRYDGLTKQLGGNQVNAIGWGIGIERLLLLIQHNISIVTRKICIYIATQKLEYLGYSLQLLPIIQKYNLKYELDVSGSSIKKQLQKANQQNSMICIIIGSQEIEQQTVTVKWLYKHTQENYSLPSFSELIPKIALQYNNIIQKKHSTLEI
uniref:Histidine--tRNA ligase, chloroplastic n=1 Tax=Trichogloeopsis pedicellata TaxID=1495610 RepID=A0A1G4P0T5_9FLOR|nr:Histidine-tRNA ligase [Trichogloeopsis pedicellata]SCW24502.1 Histidine-tRNA ligase [Trichogloeopsis pedicellata]